MNHISCIEREVRPRIQDFGLSSNSVIDAFVFIFSYYIITYIIELTNLVLKGPRLNQRRFEKAQSLRADYPVLRQASSFEMG